MKLKPHLFPRPTSNYLTESSMHPRKLSKHYLRSSTKVMDKFIGGPKCFFRLSTSHFSPAIVAKSASYRSLVSHDQVLEQISRFFTGRQQLSPQCHHLANANVFRLFVHESSGISIAGLISVTDRQDQNIFSQFLNALWTRMEERKSFVNRVFHFDVAHSHFSIFRFQDVWMRIQIIDSVDFYLFCFLFSPLLPFLLLLVIFFVFFLCLRYLY